MSHLLPRRRVLLVDDSPDEREMYAEWFRLQGYSTLQADSAAEAYRLALQLPPDIAIVDIALAGVDNGLHLTRRLKGLAAARTLPVVVLSGHVFPSDREEAARAGCDLFVPKPCRPDVLQRVVEELIGRAQSCERSDFTSIPSC